MEKAEIIRRSQLVSGTGGRPKYANRLYEVSNKLPMNCKILEIGGQTGGSASLFALTVKDRGGLVFSIDPGFMHYSKQAKYDKSMHIGGDIFSFTETLIQTEAEGYVMLLPGSSEEVLKRWNKKILFDMIFIDGWHTYEGVKIDMNWLECTNFQAICLFDDWSKDIERACNEYINQHSEWKKMGLDRHTVAFQRN